MHFSIPETEECRDESSTTPFTLYKIYVNGAHHCSVRFSQLHNLSQQIINEFSSIVDLPQFPPKKFFSLSLKDKEDRRTQLERYLQLTSHLPRVLNSDVFINFFTNAQKETQREPETDVDLAVYLVNATKIMVNIKSYDQTEEVLEKIVNKINLNPDFGFYFSLFLVKKDNDESIKIIRRLQEFESPYISLKSANRSEQHKLLLKKSVFDLGFELELHDDRVAMELLYIQAVDDFSQGFLKLDASVQNQLENLKQKNSKREFLKLISTQTFYGCLHFKSCICDFPEPNTKALVSLGNRTLYFRIFNNGVEINEIQYRITRIRCWKIAGVTTLESNGKRTTNLELCFEYLMSKDNFKWINIKTDQAILISMSLQIIVDEILLKHEGKRIKKMSERSRARVTTPFLTRQKSLIHADRKRSQGEIFISRNDLVENDDFITNDDL